VRTRPDVCDGSVTLSILIAVETFVLVLLTLLVAGLLRSHAEILRRIAETEGTSLAGAPDLPPGRDQATPATDVAGTTPHGDAVKVAVTGLRENTLLAFLSTGCLPCVPLWRSLSSPNPPVFPDRTRLVLLTKDRSHESVSKLRELAPEGTQVVMSSAAWEHYGVKGSPYFIYVDGASGHVHSEGTAGSWEQVLSLLQDALLDAGPGREGDGSAERIRRADTELAAAGIHPGHPSLWGNEPTRDAGKDGHGQH